MKYYVYWLAQSENIYGENYRKILTHMPLTSPDEIKFHLAHSLFICTIKISHRIKHEVYYLKLHFVITNITVFTCLVYCYLKTHFNLL